jgi:hypothetical protein
MVVAGEGDIRIDAGGGEVGDVVVGAVAGVGEEASRRTPGVGPDLLDETGQRAGSAVTAVATITCTVSSTTAPTL